PLTPGSEHAPTTRIRSSRKSQPPRGASRGGFSFLKHSSGTLRQMSHLVARILLATFVLPLGALVYVSLFITLDHDRGRLIDWLIPGAATWVVVGVYWTAVWRKSVPQTNERRAGTLGVTMGALIAAVFIGGALTYLNGPFGLLVGSCLAPLLWLV